jgi:branched-chain amino acid transport system permease protein
VIRLLDSRSGRAIRSLAGGSQMAEAMGVNTLRFKIGIFVLAAMLASISGWLFAHFQRTVNPTPFGLKMGIEYLFMAVLGGAAHVWGAIARRGHRQAAEDQLQVLLPKLIGTAGSYELIVFGIMIVLVLKYLPDGLWAFVDRRCRAPRRSVDWQGASGPARARQAGRRRSGARRAGHPQDLRRAGGGERHQLSNARRRRSSA